MSRFVSRIFMAAILATASFSALAVESPSWDYMSLGWIVTGKNEIGSNSYDTKGYTFDASKSFFKYMIVRAESNEYDASISGAHADMATGQVGLGGHFPLYAGPVTFDMWGAGNYQRVAIEGLVGTGPSVDLGLRTSFSKIVEVGLSGKVYGKVDFTLPDSKAKYTGYTVKAAFFITPMVAVQGSLNNYQLKLDSTGEKLKYKNVFGLGVKFAY